LHTNFVVFLKSMFYLKEMSLTAVLDTHVNNCITQSEASRKITVTSARNIPRLIQINNYNITHSAHTKDNIQCIGPATTSNLRFN